MQCWKSSRFGGTTLWSLLRISVVFNYLPIDIISLIIIQVSRKKKIIPFIAHRLPFDRHHGAILRCPYLNLHASHLSYSTSPGLPHRKIKVLHAAVTGKRRQSLLSPVQFYRFPVESGWWPCNATLTPSHSRWFLLIAHGQHSLCRYCARVAQRTTGKCGRGQAVPLCSKTHLEV